MTDESIVQSPEDSEAEVPLRKPNTRLTIIVCFLVMCLLCCVCLAVRFFCVPPGEVPVSSVCFQDIYARYDFPYVDKSGSPMMYRAEDRLAKAGDSVSERDRALLSAYNQFMTERQKSQHSVENLLQMLLFMCGMLLCFLFCLNSMRPTFFRHRNNVVLCLVLTALHFGLVTGSYVWMKSHGYESSMHLLSLLPLCLVPGLATHLMGTRVSICLALLLTSLTALLMEGEFQFVLFQYSLICSLIGIAIYRPVRCYKQLISAGLMIFLAVFALDLVAMWHRQVSWPWVELMAFWDNVCGLSFWSTWEWRSILSELQLSAYWRNLLCFALINSVFTTVMMMVLPKLFERFFDVVSPISLHSLGSLEHPLLERLRKEARGTYEHCMAVGQMAGDAAEAIGADKMLAKMCGYFHDIGKLCDPRCFAENAYAAESPHRYLSPYESSNRIRAHVKQGAELGHKFHLQRPLIEAIRCHHGNDLVAYFYRKAVKEAEASNLRMPDEKDFRYEAPLPHRSEAVIVEIADICEAASRAELSKLDLVDRAVVKQFVDKLVMSKLTHGQFADSDMTMADFTKVCDSMVDSLCSRYHQRPKYSEDEPQPQGPPSGMVGTLIPESNGMGSTPAVSGTAPTQILSSKPVVQAVAQPVPVVSPTPSPLAQNESGVAASPVVTPVPAVAPLTSVAEAVAPLTSVAEAVAPLTSVAEAVAPSPVISEPMAQAVIPGTSVQETSAPVVPPAPDAAVSAAPSVQAAAVPVAPAVGSVSGDESSSVALDAQEGVSSSGVSAKPV